MVPDPTDAKCQLLLFKYGVASAKDVIAWSDSLIAAIDDPPIALLELSSTPPSNWGDIVSYLNVLARGADSWKALRAAVPHLYHFVIAHPDDAERIANALYLMLLEFWPEKVPHEFEFIYQFDDAFYLAREGIYGDIHAVYEDFISELRRFAE